MVDKVNHNYNVTSKKIPFPPSDTADQQRVIWWPPLSGGDLQSQSVNNIFLQVDSTVDRSKKLGPIFFRTKNVVLCLHMAIFCSQIYITGQNFKVLQMTSNLAYICSIKF